jgi:hypothetical protein
MHDSKSENKNKPILIIPAAGKSSRFQNMKPKWMLTHPSGKLMIEKVVEGLSIDDYSMIYFVVLREHCQKYEADLILKQCFHNIPHKVVVLEESTNSSPETVYNCVIKENINGPIVVKDCDCLVSYNSPNLINFVVGIDINSSIRNIQQKSFILINQNNIIQEIVEKKIVSDKICLGVYGMHSNDFIKSFFRLNQTIVTELYFSHIISDIIDTYNKVFVEIDAKHFIDWGTKEEWFSSANLKNTYFVDIDGIMLENTGKYGSKNWYNTIEPIEKNISTIKQLSDEGHEIIFVTSRPFDALEKFKDLLKNKNIKYKTIIDSCLHSKRIIINDFAASNPFPSCLAINIPRNELIESYLR